MATFSSLALSLAGPLVKRALTAIGIGVVSYAAVSAAFSAAQTAVINQWGQVAGNMAWMAERAGFLTGIGIVLAAYAAKLGLQAASKLGSISS